MKWHWRCCRVARLLPKSCLSTEKHFFYKTHLTPKLEKQLIKNKMNSFQCISVSLKKNTDAFQTGNEAVNRLLYHILVFGSSYSSCWVFGGLQYISGSKHESCDWLRKRKGCTHLTTCPENILSTFLIFQGQWNIGTGRSSASQILFLVLGSESNRSSGVPPGGDSRKWLRAVFPEKESLCQTKLLHKGTGKKLSSSYPCEIPIILPLDEHDCAA